MGLTFKRISAWRVDIDPSFLSRLLGMQDLRGCHPREGDPELTKLLDSMRQGSLSDGEQNPPLHR